MWNQYSKNDFQTDKKNCGPISILSNIYKIHESCLSKQGEEYFQPLLSKYKCDFRKSNPRLFPMIKKLRKSRNESGVVAALQSDLS